MSTGTNIEEPLVFGCWFGDGVSRLASKGVVRIGSRHCSWPDAVVEESASRTVAVLLLGPGSVGRQVRNLTSMAALLGNSEQPQTKPRMSLFANLLVDCE